MKDVAGNVLGVGDIVAVTYSDGDLTLAKIKVMRKYSANVRNLETQQPSAKRYTQICLVKKAEKEMENEGHDRYIRESD